MAHSTIAQRCAALGVDRRSAHWADFYKGTREALIAAGVIAASQPLPGAPGLGKVQACFYDGKPLPKGKTPPNKDQRYLRITRVGRQYEVCCGVSLAEEKRRLAERERQAQERKEAVSEAVAADPERLRLVMRLAADELSRLLRNHTLGEHKQGKPVFSCRFDAEGFDEVLEALGEIQDWIDSAEVRAPSKEAQKLNAARKDQGFQAFLQSQCLGGDA